MSTDRAMLVSSIHRKKWFRALAVIVAACAGLWLWQYVAFPNTPGCQEMIRTADRVEVRASIIGSEDKGTDFLVLTDPSDLAALANSFRITGIWTPLDYSIGNSYRLRIIKKQATTDIFIRGWGGIMSGMWTARIDGKRYFAAVKELVRKNGAQMPDWRKIIDQMSTTNTTRSVP